MDTKMRDTHMDHPRARMSAEEERHRLTLEGMADVSAGRVVAQADVQAWAASLASASPLPVPQR